MMKAIVFRVSLLIGLVILLAGAFVVPSADSTDLNQGLVGYWSFDEGSGIIAHDYSGNGNDGTISGGATWVPGIYGSALEFDGIDDYVSVPDNDVLDIIDNKSIVAWIYLEDIPYCGPIVAKGTNPSNNCYFLATGTYYASYNPANQQLNSATGEGAWLNSTQPITTGSWYQIVAIRDNSTIMFYINGALDATGLCFAGHLRTNDMALTLGYYPYTGNWHFHGIMDEVRIYNRALSADEIQYLYQHPGGQNQPPTAVIDTILPKNTEEDFPILFRGHGQDQDGSIAAWEWKRWDDVVFGSQPEFVTTLPQSPEFGNVISFKVQDDDGAWSDAVTKEVKIYPQGTLDKHWTFPTEEFLYMGRWNDFSFYAHNQRSNQFDYFDVLYGLDYTCTEPVPGLENSAHLYGDPFHPYYYTEYSWKDTVLGSLPGGGAYNFRFNVRTHWDWITPWGITNAITIFFRCLPGVGALGPEWEIFQYALAELRAWGNVWLFINTVRTVQNVLGVYVAEQLQFDGLGNSQEGTPFTVYVLVPQDKIALYSISIGTGFGAVTATLIPLPWNWAIELALTAASQWTYIAAYDPDSNYTELVSPQFIYPPELDSIQDPEARATSYEAFRAVGYLHALESSYAKYMGALYDHNEHWSAIQLSAVQVYSQLAAECLKPMPNFLDSNIVPPTQAQIDSMRNYFTTNGLPKYEQNGLALFGYSQETIDSLGDYFATVPNEYYYATDSIPSFLRKAINDLDSLPRDFGEIPGGAKLAVLGTNPATLYLNNPSAILNCWVEFPKDSNITGCQIISAVLNDTIQASYISPTPGDYDHDGIPDIAMQFSTITLISMLQPGQRLLSVSGDVVLPSADTVLYSGAAILTILEFLRGDANGDGVVDISDVVYLINYLFIHGPAPVPLEAGDATCNGVVDASDLVYLLNYLFAHGPAPGC